VNGIGSIRMDRDNKSRWDTWWTTSEAREVNEETSALACARPTPERTDFHPLGV